jgi:hypothetical protein
MLPNAVKFLPITRRCRVLGLQDYARAALRDCAAELGKEKGTKGRSATVEGLGRKELEDGSWVER